MFDLWNDDFVQNLSNINFDPFCCRDSDPLRCGVDPALYEIAFCVSVPRHSCGAVSADADIRVRYTFGADRAVCETPRFRADGSVVAVGRDERKKKKNQKNGLVPPRRLMIE